MIFQLVEFNVWQQEVGGWGKWEGGHMCLMTLKGATCLGRLLASPLSECDQVFWFSPLEYKHGLTDWLPDMERG